MDTPIIIKNPFIINNRTKRIYHSGTLIPLRNKLFNLLSYLILNQGIVISRDQLLQRVWDMNSILNTNTVDVHISQLRKLLKKMACRHQINTVHCQGYIFEIDNKESF